MLVELAFNLSICKKPNSLDLETTCRFSYALRVDLLESVLISVTGLFRSLLTTIVSRWLRLFSVITVAFFLIGFFWWQTERRIFLAEQEARGLAMRQSASLANSYAAQLQHVAD